MNGLRPGWAGALSPVSTSRSRRTEMSTDLPPRSAISFARAASDGVTNRSAPLSRRLYFENPLHAPNCLICEVEPAIELAVLEFVPLERGQGRGGRQRC